MPQPLKASVAVLGFEPVIQALLQDLLEAEPELSLIQFSAAWNPGQPYQGPIPDVLLIAHRPDWQEVLHQQFPHSVVLSQAGWRATSPQGSAPLFEGGAGYQGLIRSVKAVVATRD